MLFPVGWMKVRIEWNMRDALFAKVLVPYIVQKKTEKDEEDSDYLLHDSNTFFSQWRGKSGKNPVKTLLTQNMFYSLCISMSR